MELGKRVHLLSFQKREDQGSDGLGNTLSAFVDQFTTRGHLRFLFGGEDVIAARLEGRQTAILSVLQSFRIDEVCSDWRVVDCRTGKSYNVRSVEPSEDRRRVEFRIESGVNDG